MSSSIVDEALFQRLLLADELGIRLEIVGGLPMWVASPFLHRLQPPRTAGAASDADLIRASSLAG